MAVGTWLTPSLDKPVVDLTIYRSMIGSLLYLTASRPDIMFSVCFFIQAYSDSDFGGCSLDRKSTSGGCQLLDGKLVSWQSKKQTCVANSTAEVEYVAAIACTSQIIWIQSQLRDYAINMKKIPLCCYSQSAIHICHNPKQVLFQAKFRKNEKKVLRTSVNSEFVSN
ncbi:uncharacterized mitochondrial protein AtMg00810-like [Lactuca sativa]|uniref:uncharacterized mitochondrial protein AtMg00810-like n=1 Tax=Lactuca sativa TaxID=4236 RepID=UPI0022AEB07A|nr:uncharacterized mitochondrial protein AtMg00810-like [Lactuca sativa]